MPEVPTPAEWSDVLRRAFWANGELESAYFEWKAAYWRIDQAAGYPNVPINLGFEYMFSSEKLKAWDRSTISGGFVNNALTFPTKVAKAGEVALEEARRAGEKFRAVKFDVQRRVLNEYLELTLTEEKIRIQRDNVALLKMLSETAVNRVQAGGPQQDLLKAQMGWRLAENELGNMEAQAKACGRG